MYLGLCCQGIKRASEFFGDKSHPELVSAMRNKKSSKTDKPRIYIIDVTNRDGAQAYGTRIGYIERTMINRYLNEMGIDQSEFAFPVVPLEENYIISNLELVKLGYLSPIKLSGWVRATYDDIEKAGKFKDLKHVNLSISTSDVMIRGKFRGRKNEKDIIHHMIEAVKRAKELNFETIGVNAEDASRTRHWKDQSYLEEFSLAAKDAGAHRIRYCDTLGFDRSFSIYNRVKQLAEKVKLPVELHCHNDTGFAVANSIEGAMGALHAGVDAIINTTINGLGERAGNADLVSVLLSLKYSSGIQESDILDPKINLKMSWKICNYVSLATGIPISPNQPGIGSKAHSHESGIHADGMLKSHDTYELYGPEELGIPLKVERETGRRIGVGTFSGRSALKHVLKKYDIETGDIDETLELVQRASYDVKRTLMPDELRLITEYPKQVRRML